MENPGNKKVDKIKYTFKKEERLCSKKIIDQLFSGGASFLSFPLKVIYVPGKLPSKYPVQAAFSASKKNFKRAVKRNLLKRRMRESYRLHKHTLYEDCDKQLAVFFIYVGKEIVEYKRIESAMKKALVRLQKEMRLKNANESG